MSAQTVPDRALRSAFLALLLPLLIALPTYAHNGAVAIAVPVEGITIDGDLSDWPEDMVRYPVALPESGEAPKGAADLRADFRVAFDPDDGILYVAVEAWDDSIVTVPLAAGVYMQDGCEVYLDLRHEMARRDSTPQYAVWGDIPHGPGVVPLDQDRVDVRVMTSLGHGRRIYEWRFDLSVSSAAISWGPSLGPASDSM